MSKKETISQEKVTLEWRVNTAALLKEIVNNNKNIMQPLGKPIQIFANILMQLGQCAARINDPELNHLMSRLAIYSSCDPYSDDYDPLIVKRLEEASEAFKASLK